MESKKGGSHFYLALFIVAVAILGIFYISNLGETLGIGSSGFSITGFSVYNVTGDINVTAWTNKENSAVYVNQNITFFANYTNSSVFVDNSNCSISFDFGSSIDSMTVDVGGYNYTLNASVPGNYTYAIGCENSTLGLDLVYVVDYFVVVDVANIGLSNLTNSSNYTAGFVWFDLNVPGNVSIEYGENESVLGNFSNNTNFYIHHNLTLTGLVNSTQYFYNITVWNETGFSNTTGPYSFMSVIPDVTSANWSKNQTNSTITGLAAKHSVYWSDDRGLSGYIFSFDNGNGTFYNDSFVALSGLSNWSNVTKVLNSTNNSVIRWMVYLNDSSDNWNSTFVFTYNATLDETAPIVSGRSHSRTDETATITFDTDEPANSSVEYGETTSLGTYSNNNTDFYTNHRHVLTNLEPDTAYYYNVTVCDIFANCGINPGGPFMFTTSEADTDDEVPVSDAPAAAPAAAAAATASTTSQNESRTSWIREQAGVDGKVDLAVNITNWMDATVNIDNTKGTAVVRMVLSAEGSILGNLYISEVSGGEVCDLSNFGNYRLYRTLLFDHTFPNENITYVEVGVHVDPDWIRENSVDDIFIFRCEDREAIQMKLEDLRESLYIVRSSGFSTWAVLGVERQKSVSSGGFFGRLWTNNKMLIFIFLGVIVLGGGGAGTFFFLKSKGIIADRQIRQLRKNEKMRSEKIGQIAKGKIPVSGTKVVSPQIQDPEIVNLNLIKHPSLKNYVKQCLDLGLRKSQIIEELRKSGWPEDYLKF